MRWQLAVRHCEHSMHGCAAAREPAAADADAVEVADVGAATPCPSASAISSRPASHAAVAAVHWWRVRCWCLL